MKNIWALLHFNDYFTIPVWAFSIENWGNRVTAMKIE